MKDPKKMKTFGAEHALFLEKLSDLVVEEGFQGPIPGEPKLSSAGEKLSLEEITLNRVLMGFPEDAALTLRLGADPSHTHRGLSLRQLNDAFEKVHGNKEHQKMDAVLDQYGVPKKTLKSRPTKS